MLRINSATKNLLSLRLYESKDKGDKFASEH